MSTGYSGSSDPLCQYKVSHIANSDEWADFMLPFAEKIESAQDEGAFDDLDDESPLAFLKAWQGKEVVSEEQVSQITEPGRRDAFGMGKRMRHLYAPLFPPKDVGKGKDKGKNITVSFSNSFRFRSGGAVGLEAGKLAEQLGAC